MGFGFRKSIKLGPLRVNLSKSGVGASVGVPGLRVGVSSKGQRYMSASGGGLTYRSSSGAPKGNARFDAPEQVVTHPLRWFLTWNGETTGPFDYPTIAQFQAEGRLLAGTFAGQEGGTAWFPVEELLAWGAQHGL